MFKKPSADTAVIDRGGQWNSSACDRGLVKLLGDAYFVSTAVAVNMDRRADAVVTTVLGMVGVTQNR